VIQIGYHGKTLKETRCLEKQNVAQMTISFVEMPPFAGVNITINNMPSSNTKKNIYQVIT
jgi:hypothetical protein